MDIVSTVLPFRRRLIKYAIEWVTSLLWGRWLRQISFA